MSDPDPAIRAVGRHAGGGGRLDPTASASVLDDGGLNVRVECNNRDDFWLEVRLPRWRLLQLLGLAPEA